MTHLPIAAATTFALLASALIAVSDAHGPITIGALAAWAISAAALGGALMRAAH